MVVTSRLDERSSALHMCIKRVQRAPSSDETLTFSRDTGAASPRDDISERVGHASRDALRATHVALTNDGTAASYDDVTILWRNYVDIHNQVN